MMEIWNRESSKMLQGAEAEFHLKTLQDSHLASRLQEARSWHGAVLQGSEGAPLDCQREIDMYVTEIKRRKDH
jgi:hypothetical protein